MADEEPKTAQRKTALSGQVPAVERRRVSQAAVLLALLAAVITAEALRRQLFGLDEPVRFAAAVFAAALGFTFARALGRALVPAMTRRLGAATAGSVDFLVRIAAIVIVLLVSLRLAGVKPEALAAAAGVATLVLGFASSQTLSQVVAGAVILTSRRFSVGDRIHVLSPQLEGTVKTVGLLYTEIDLGKDTVSVPNSSLLSASIIPIKSPATVEMRASLPHGMRPSHAEQTINSTIITPTQADPSVTVDRVGEEQFSVSVTATPARASDRQRLMDEMTDALARFQTNGQRRESS